MRYSKIDELVELWRKAENFLAEQNDEEALKLKTKFEIKCNKLTLKEINELNDIIEGMAG